MKAVIDRFEGKFAVCEADNGQIINIEKSSIPKDAKEGDVLIFDSNGILIDEELTEKSKADIQKLMEDVWE